MVDVNLAVVVGAIVFVGLLVAGGFGLAIHFLVGLRDERAKRLERERDEALAMAQHRAELLDQAKLHLAEAEADGRAAIERRAALDEALRAAPPGGRLDAVERLLRDDAARRARREAEARLAAAGQAAADAGRADPPGARGVDRAHA